jgi:hypothetical protein
MSSAAPCSAGGQSSTNPAPEPATIKLSVFLGQGEREKLDEWIGQHHDKASARNQEEHAVFPDYLTAAQHVHDKNLLLLPTEHGLNLGERAEELRWWHPQGQLRGVQRCPTKETWLCVPGMTIGAFVPTTLATKPDEETIKVDMSLHCAAQHCTTPIVVS